MKRIFVLLSILFQCVSGWGLNCPVAMAKSDAVKRFLMYSVAESERPRAVENFNTFKWLKVYLAENNLPADDLDILDVCFRADTKVRLSTCDSAIEAVSTQIFLMNRHLRDAQACEMSKLPEPQRSVLNSLIEKSEQFHARMVESYHDVEWGRAMQRALKALLSGTHN